MHDITGHSRGGAVFSPLAHHMVYLQTCNSVFLLLLDPLLQTQPCPWPHSYAESLTLKMTDLETRPLKEVSS